jgi:hypothetical protein
MRSWTAMDDIAVIHDHFRCRAKVGGIGTAGSTVGTALCAHPNLGLLANHARTDHSMVNAFWHLGSLNSRLAWCLKLDEMALIVVPQVINSCIAELGADKLTLKQRRRMAASVFQLFTLRTRNGTTRYTSF